MMQLPYTLDLNSLVKYDPNGASEQTSLKWLNDENALSGFYYFLYGVYHRNDNHYCMQVWSMDQVDLDHSPNLKEKIKESLSDSNASALNSLIEPKLKDFKKPGVWIPGQTHIYFNKDALRPDSDQDKIHIESYQRDIRQYYSTLLNTSLFNLAGELKEITFFDGSRTVMKKFSFHENKELAYFELENSQAIKSAALNPEGKLVVFTPKDIVTSEENWEKNFRTIVEAEVTSVKAEASIIQQNYKVKL